MRVLVCGDRNWTDRDLIETQFYYLARKVDSEPGGGDEPVIIEGEARGADTIARLVAKDFGWEILKFPAQWSKHGRSAGPIRNQQMLDKGKPDLVLAFHDDIEHSKGTKDLVTRARKAGIKVRVISHEKREER